MQVTVSDRDDENIVTVSLETEPGRAKEAYSKTLKKLGKNVTIKGFRKGKAPTQVLEEHFGAETIRAETINNEFLSQLLDEAFAAEKLSVVHISNIEKVEFNSPDDPVLIEAKVELFPEVELPDISKLKLKVQIPKADPEKQYEETIERLRIQHAEFKESDEAVEMLDEVVFDFDGKFKNDDGEWEEKAGMKAEGFQTIIESGRFIENFLEQMVGMKSGEDKELIVKFPDDYHDGELAGRDAKFDVKVHKVSKADKPEIDDEFAKKFDTKDAEDLKSKVRAEIDNLIETTRKGIASEAVVRELHDQADVNLSEAMVSREMEHGLATMQYQNNWTESQIKKYITEMDRDKEMADAREKLEKSVLITTIIRKQNLEVSTEEVQDHLSRLNLPQDTSGIDIPALVNKINLDLLTQKAIDFLVENADIEYEEVEGHVHGPDCDHDH